MNYQRLLVTIGLLAICSFTLVHNSSLDHKPVVHVLLNDLPIDFHKRMPLESQGFLGLMMVDEDRMAEALKFRIMLVGDYQTAHTPLHVNGVVAFSKIPVESILQHAHSGDHLLIEISNLKRPLYYTPQLGS